MVAEIHQLTNSEAREVQLRSLRGAARSVKTGRVTSSYIGDDRASAQGMIGSAWKNYAPLAYSLPWEILDVVELLSTYNPDFSQAVENLKMLANTGHDLVVDAASDLQRKNVKEFLEFKARTIQESHGGIDGVIDKLMDQAAVYGAMAGEWILNEDLTEVIDFADINPKKIRFFWIEEEQKWVAHQRVSMIQAKEAEKNGQEVRNSCVRLNEITFRYFSFDAAPGSPYGTPPFLAAIQNIGIQRDLVHNMAQIVKKIGLLGIIDLSVQQLQPNPGESQADFEGRASAYLDMYVTAVEEMVKEGGLVHYDDVEAKTYNIGGNAAGATNIHKQNEELIFSGLKSMPSMQGRCVVPETLVLTSSLEWVQAGSLCLGDELIGFDEDLGKGRGKGAVARMKPSLVECVDRIKLPCVKVITDQGEITVSENHPMVMKHRSQTDRVWKEASEIQEGDKLIWFGQPWEVSDSYDAGYLAGLFDGEGHLGFHGSGKNGTLTFAQREGVVLEETVLAMKRLGFEAYVGEANGGTHQDVAHARLLGGKFETLRFIGTVRPHRFLAKSRQCWDGASLRNGGSVNQTARRDVYANVLSVEKVGVKQVVALQTSSRTFFSEGFLSHNSYSTTETYAGVAYDIIIRNTLKYQRGAKRMIESGYWLCASLGGLKPTNIGIRFHENRSLGRLQERQADSIEIRNVAMKWALGLIDQGQGALELGYDMPKIPLAEFPVGLVNLMSGVPDYGDFGDTPSSQATMEE